MNILLNACSDGDLEKVKELHQQEVDVCNDELSLRETAVHEQLEIIIHLVENCRSDVYIDIVTALNLAEVHGCLKVVKYLIKECGIDIYNDKLTLNLAARSRNLDIIKYLVEECDVDVHKIDLNYQEKIDLINQLDLDQKLRDKLLLELV